MKNMAELKFIEGDATNPLGTGNKIIVHICNDIGGWGKGFVLAISKRWKSPELQYRKWYESGNDFELGKVQFVQVEEDTWVANLIGQHKIRKDEQGNPPIRYSAIKIGMTAVQQKAKELGATVHMPRIGCGLAGGKWEKIQPIIDHELVALGVDTTGYDFK